MSRVPSGCGRIALFEDELPVEVRRAIIAQRLDLWQRSRYQVMLDAYVLRQLEGIPDDAARCARAIDVLEALLAEIGTPSVLVGG
jgi:hypothetical protein